MAVRYAVSRRHHSLHATYLAEQQQQQHPNPKRKPKQPDHPPVSFLTSYGDLGHALTPNGTIIALLNSQAYEFRSQSSTSPQKTIPPTSLKPRLDTNFCGYNHATRTPDPNTPLSFALVTLFHPKNRVVTNQKIDLDPKNKSKSKNVEEEALTLSNIRITMALRGKFR